ncbi:MAG: DNA-directed RNA polymerase subunit beta [Parcubacteria group bacterium]|nr:DNA-directed RNA polymerase subunit beta [Parcubacteria group bacterium]
MKKRVFSSYKYKPFPLPNLLEVQINSYKWFINKGLREIFDEISPIEDYTGANLELSFGEYYFDEPKYSQDEAKDHFTSYEAPLRVKARLKNKRTNEIKEQEVYLGDFPLMTSRGTFIINGVERVIVSQLIRSSGVFFTVQNTRNKNQFGAKIIPNRGAWLEFETDYEGVISVKIDRKRKVPISSLLRIFGLHEDEEIIEAFSGEDIGETAYIKATLAKDPAKALGEAYIEIYKRIRPGDLATAENAKGLIDAMFGPQRYDLSQVGRWKTGERLNKPVKLKPSWAGRDLNKSASDKVIHLADLVNIISEIIRLNNDQTAKADDIDHLGNRRVRAMGELVQQRLRLGFARLERIAKDRMSTLDINTIAPAQLVNARPLIAVVKEFFASSQLSQFMDQINPLAELEHKRRLSALGPGGLARERAGFEVRDVHTSHYGRICPIETPEGPNIGLVEYFSSYARLNDFGFIETPYRVVKNGRLTDEIKHLNALDEEKHYIAHGGVKVDAVGSLSEEFVQVRHRAEPTLVEKNQVEFMDVSPQQIISISTSLIPFLEHDDANRALMGSNMQRQAVPCVKPQVPWVGTGVEERAVQDSGYVILAEEDGLVEAVDGRSIKVKYQKSVKDKMRGELKMIRTEDIKGGGEEVKYKLHNFIRSNQYTSLNQFPRVAKGQKVKKGEVLADGISTENGALALGQNLTVAFMSWRGGNFEDAIILSEKLVEQDIFSSIHIESYSIDIRETKLGPEIPTPDIPNVSEEKLKDLDEEGIVRIGAEVGQGDILVGKISPKGEADLTAEERLLRAIFGEKARDVKDASLHLPHGKRGRVVGVKIFERDKGDKLPAGVIKTIQVEVAEYRRVSVGDKLAGRHGNKGVISMILPEEEMPYMEDGRSVDVILNPLGVASRMNIGQILETHLGWAMKAQGARAVTPALAGATEAEIKAELKAAGLPEDGKVTLYDGQTGEQFSQRVTVGVIYIMKLNHLVEDKIHMRSIGPYSLITQQPLGGKAQFGGQRFGEMEVWALEGYGAAHILQEMLTIKSDDVVGRGHTYESIIKGEPIRTPNIPASFFVLVNEMKGLGLNVELIGSEVVPPVEFRQEIKEEAKAAV